jgi:hypothetical protein
LGRSWPRMTSIRIRRAPQRSRAPLDSPIEEFLRSYSQMPPGCISQPSEAESVKMPRGICVAPEPGCPERARYMSAPPRWDRTADRIVCGPVPNGSPPLGAASRQSAVALLITVPVTVLIGPFGPLVMASQPYRHIGVEG